MKCKALMPGVMPEKPFCHDIQKYLDDPIHHIPKLIENYDGKFFNMFNRNAQQMQQSSLT